MFLVKYKTSEQISPDDWDTFFKEKLFDENTTLKQVKEWVVSTYSSNADKTKLCQVFLSEPEK